MNESGIRNGILIARVHTQRVDTLEMKKCCIRDSPAKRNIQEVDTLEMGEGSICDVATHYSQGVDPLQMHTTAASVMVACAHPSIESL